MPEPGNKDQTQQVTESKSQGNPLQVFREAISGIISLVILGLAAYMMAATFRTIGDGVKDNEARLIQARKDAYDRQKDIMLYALALLGTVTGYYLGRVPAELHAQQAQRAATSAQQQLKDTQTKLTDTATTAASAATKLGDAQVEKAKVKTTLNRATDVLKTVSGALSEALNQSDAQTAKLGDRADETADSTFKKLKNTKEQIDKILTLIELEGG